MARAALALPFSGLHGSLGNASIVQRPDGPVVRARNYRPRPLSEGQAASAGRMRLVGEAWRLLDDATYESWRAFARRSAWRNAATGAVVVPQPYRLFSGLAAKALQVEPGRSLAGFAPPERAFLGDGVAVTLEPPSLAGERGGLGGESASIPGDSDSPSPAPSSPGTSHPRKEGVLTLAADRANAPGVVTEIVAQPLVNARRAVYEDKYAAKAFVAFEGAETVEVPLTRGCWALGYRFVLAATGQETAIVALGIATVG